MDLNETGQVQVYTGDGKGKTTSALGAGLRAAGHGLRVLMICFMKARIAERDGESEVNYGEFGSVEQISNFEIVPVGRLDWVDKDNPDPIDV
ncbi:MAG: cob(I)yrinic acid a,c-diamide adenosyltransferase, partial [Promethearchaeota archaeon]